MIKLGKKRKRFNIIQSVDDIKKECDELPTASECFKYVSMGNFASISFIVFVASHTKIKNLYVSTFRVGKKEMQILHSLHKSGVLGYVRFLFFGLMESDNEKYGYYKTMQDVCNANKWDYGSGKNHSKIMLFDTDAGKFVIETSSNLNENPKIEQFQISFEKDEDLYNFYLKWVFSNDEH